MASSNISPVTPVPWPVLAGASLLLHVGALGWAWPRLVQVGNPAAPGVVDIPVMLVEEEMPPPVPANLPQTAPAAPKTIPEAIPARETATAAPLEQLEETEQEVRSQPSPQQETTAAETPPAPPTAEAPQIPVSETAPKAPDTGDNRPIENNPQDAGDAAETQSTGPTQVTIVTDVRLPKNSGGDQIDEYPVSAFSIPLTLAIPPNHSCQGSLSTDTVDVGIIIDEQGAVSSLSRWQADIYAQDPNRSTADCLLNAALGTAPPLQFAPAIRLTNIGTEEAVPTDRVQLRLQFSED